MKSLHRLVVRAKIVGRRGPALAPLEIAQEEPLETARELLAAVVREQVDSFRKRKEESSFLRILTQREIADGSQAGKIVPGQQDRDERVPTVEEAVAAAVTAFHDGFYYMFLNDVQVEDLDQRIAQTDVSDVLFVRLTPLAGG